MKYVLEEQNKKHSLALERDFLWSFSTLWMFFEKQKEAVKINSDDHEPQQKMADICVIFEQSVTMIGQAANALSYQRRVNALSILFQDNKKAKNILKEQKM